MFTPLTLTSAAFDPIERDRIEIGRPASRMEVLERHEQVKRHDVFAQSTAMVATQDERHSKLQIVPDTIDSVRRSLSRMLVHAGERIGPEAA